MARSATTNSTHWLLSCARACSAKDFPSRQRLDACCIYGRQPREPAVVRLSIAAGNRRRADARCGQAARETLKGSFRQDSEHRTRLRKVLQGADAGFRKPDTSCRSEVGRTPEMNEDARAASRRAIARILDEEAAAVERTPAHVIGLHRTDVRALC